jgi:hypothetical protein
MNYLKINKIFATGVIPDYINEYNPKSIEDLFRIIKLLQNGQIALNDYLLGYVLVNEETFIKKFKEIADTCNPDRETSFCNLQSQFDTNAENITLPNTDPDPSPSDIDISFILSDPRLSSIYMNTYRIEIYDGTDCDKINEDIIKLIKLLSVISKEINNGKSDQYLINMHEYLVRAIKNHFDFLPYCKKSDPPAVPSSSDPITLPPPPPPPHQSYIYNPSRPIPIPYYNFYTYNGTGYDQIPQTDNQIKLDCEEFKEWKCVDGDEITKYKIRINGKSDVCHNCTYGIQLKIDHGWDNGREYYKMKYCGTGVCDSPSFKYKSDTKYNISGNEILKLLIDVYTGRSLVYPEYYFITKYISYDPRLYMIIPIYDPEYKCTQRIQEIYYYMTISFKKEKTITITEKEMEILKVHLFENPKEIKLNTLYSNDVVNLRILKKGNVYEVLIVDSKERNKIEVAIEQENIRVEKVKQQQLKRQQVGQNECPVGEQINGDKFRNIIETLKKGEDEGGIAITTASGQTCKYKYNIDGDTYTRIA